jgi:hypothetical protein
LAAPWGHCLGARCHGGRYRVISLPPKDGTGDTTGLCRPVVGRVAFSRRVGSRHCFRMAGLRAGSGCAATGRWWRVSAWSPGRSIPASRYSRTSKAAPHGVGVLPSRRSRVVRKPGGLAFERGVGWSDIRSWFVRSRTSAPRQAQGYWATPSFSKTGTTMNRQDIMAWLPVPPGGYSPAK